MTTSYQEIRTEIARACRVLAAEGLDDMLAGHISVRLRDSDDFLVTPWGLFFSEVRPEDILRVDSTGKVVEGSYPVNMAVVIHLAVHEAVPGANAIVHCHPPHVTAFSARGETIKPFDQIGCVIFESQAVYTEFTGSVYDMEAARPIAAALEGNRVCILKNHGLLTVGKTLEAAVIDTLFTERAAKVQLLAEQFGASGKDAIDDDTARKTRDQNVWPALYDDIWSALLRKSQAALGDLSVAVKAER